MIKSSSDVPEGRRAYDVSTENDEIYRHWSPSSQHYAPVDVLLQYLYSGWVFGGTVAVEEFYSSGARCVKVYYFRLLTQEKDLWMPILENPVVLRLIREYNLMCHPAASNCETSGVEGICQGCHESGTNSTQPQRCQNGCTCAGNSALHCCCASRLLPIA